MSVLTRSYRFPIDNVRREMERMFGEEWPFFNWAPTERAYPPVNIYERPDSVVVEFEIPGINPENTDLTMTGGSITLKAKRPIEGDIPPEKYLVRERWRGEFGRTVTVPGVVDSTRAEAQYRNGLLSITIPRTEEARPKRVEVKVEDDQTPRGEAE